MYISTCTIRNPSLQFVNKRKKLVVYTIYTIYQFVDLYIT